MYFRAFFGATKFSVFLVALSMVLTSMSDNQNDGKNLRINPEYKISRISDGSVVVTSKNPKNSEFRQEFTDFYADLLMAAYRKQSINFITETLRKKYYMSEEECRREIKHAVNILSEWKIILRDDKMAMR